MLIKPYCIICILNQILRASSYLKLNEDQTRQALNAALKKASTIDSSLITSPQYAEQIYDVFQKFTGKNDPYSKLKKSQNDFVLNKIDFFQDQISNAQDPLQKAAFYSLLGNIIDFGSEKVSDISQILNTVNKNDLTINDYHEFARRLLKSKSLLFISDNAGEAVFDLFFIQEIKKIYPTLTIYYAVRSKPAINDMTLPDAEYIGLPKVAEVLESGSTMPGTIISKTTPRFFKIYQSADMVISKGQGNYETLESEEKDILFIFKIKCRVIEQFTGLKQGSMIFAFNNSLRKYTGSGKIK